MRHHRRRSRRRRHPYSRERPARPPPRRRSAGASSPSPLPPLMTPMKERALTALAVMTPRTSPSPSSLAAPVPRSPAARPRLPPARPRRRGRYSPSTAPRNLRRADGWRGRGRRSGRGSARRRGRNGSGRRRSLWMAPMPHQSHRRVDFSAAAAGGKRGRGMCLLPLREVSSILPMSRHRPRRREPRYPPRRLPRRRGFPNRLM
mmetsp:Transcript_25719/g.75870  ORF Transcript_25719/g.75870 Transcript_25719/m.75870 type:complete len:204 (+) Transcript_25719:969-1580(+)